MSDSQAASDIFGQQITLMCEAMIAHDLDGLMGHYDDGLVFIDGPSGDRLGKAGLRKYVSDLWDAQPDFTVRLVASYTHDCDFAATLVASATMLSRASGEPVQVEWMLPTIYTFDRATLKVVREVMFADDEALQRTLVNLGVA